jgi:hypothetical protein
MHGSLWEWKHTHTQLTALHMHKLSHGWISDMYHETGYERYNADQKLNQSELCCLPTNTIRIILPYFPTFTRGVCKVRGLALLLRVTTLWRCGDGLFFEVLNMKCTRNLDHTLIFLHSMAKSNEPLEPDTWYFV